MIKKIFILALLVSLLSPLTSGATTFQLGSGDLVGEITTIQPNWSDEFHGLGRKFDIGYQQMVSANPKLNPLHPGIFAKVILPARYILPPGPRVGIVINLAEMRLYYYPAEEHTVVTYPLGIGQEGWQTPQGLMYVLEKIVHPSWHVPQSIKEAYAAKGLSLPDVVPPGPKDPLGDFAMRLNLRTYLIHGTNDPVSIGMRSSSGCIRLFPEDIKDLFSRVPPGTPVQIINEPFKVGWENGQLYLEAHAPMHEDSKDAGIDLTPMSKQIYAALKNHGGTVDWQKADAVALAHEGIPQVISVEAPKVEAPKVSLKSPFEEPEMQVSALED